MEGGASPSLRYNPLVAQLRRRDSNPNDRVSPRARRPRRAAGATATSGGGSSSGGADAAAAAAGAAAGAAAAPPRAPPSAAAAVDVSGGLAPSPSASAPAAAAREAAIRELSDARFWQMEGAAAPDGAAPAVIDVGELQKIFGGSNELVRMALKRFDLKAFERLREPWERRNYRRVGQLAHQLKGTCAYIGAKQARQAAAHLEQSAKALADAEASDFLEEEVASAAHDLRAELALVAPAVQVALAQLDTLAAAPPSAS